MSNKKRTESSAESTEKLFFKSATRDGRTVKFEEDVPTIRSSRSSMIAPKIATSLARRSTFNTKHYRRLYRSGSLKFGQDTAVDKLDVIKVFNEWLEYY